LEILHVSFLSTLSNHLLSLFMVRQTTCYECVCYFTLNITSKQMHNIYKLRYWFVWGKRKWTRFV